MAKPKKAKWDELLDSQVIQPSSTAGEKSGIWLRHLLFGIGLLILCGLFSSWIHVQSITCRYKFSRTYQYQQTLRHAENALKIENQMLRSPRRIAEIAENKLGLVLPEPGDRVVMK